MNDRYITMNRYAGFTLIELIVVILLAGILSALVLPRISFDQFRDTGGFQQVRRAAF